MTYCEIETAAGFRDGRAGLVIVPLMDFQSGETPCDKISRYLKQL